MSKHKHYALHQLRDGRGLIPRRRVGLEELEGRARKADELPLGPVRGGLGLGSSDGAGIGHGVFPW